MKYRKCEICGLRSEREYGKKRYFMARFPLDEDRCKLWVKVTGNLDLAYVPIEKLNALKYVCGKHFREKDFSKKKTQLRKNAVPSLGLTAKPLSDDDLLEFPLHLYKGSPTTTKDVAIHLFPNPSKDPKRFKQWVDIVGGLQGKTELEFYKRRKICDIHFTDQCRNRFNRLNAIAVPTLHLQGETDPLDEYRIRRSKAETTIEEEYLEDDFLYDQDVQEVVSDWDESDDFQKSETVVQEPNNQVHEGFQCNVCQKDIIGFRYACVQCSDWDMCGGCEARGEHAGHYVLRVPGPKPYSEIQTILKCIRNELFPEPGHEKSIVDCEVKSENESDSDTDISKPEATEKINTIKKQTIAKAPICSKTKNNISTPINNSPNVRVYSRNTDISEPQATEKIKTTEKPTIAKVPICSKTKNNTPINKSPNFKVYSSITKVHSAPEHPPKTDINARSRIQMRPPETIKIRPPETKKKITHLKLRVPPEIKLDTLQKALRRDVVVKIKRLEQRVDYEELIKKLKISNYSNFNTNFDKHKHSNIINPTLLEP